MKNKFSLLSTLIISFILFVVCSNDVIAQPANDDCNNATLLPITVDSVCFESTNVNATASVAPLPQGTGTGYNGGDVWFSFVAPESGRVIISTASTAATPTITEGGMALYSGNCGPTLTQLALSTEGLNGSYMPRIDTDDFDLVLTEGNTYYVRFWAYDNTESGTFNMCIWTIPIIAGNTCAEATPLYVQFECNYREFHNLYSTASTGVPNPPCGSYSSGYTSTGDVWFSTVVPPNGHLIIKTAESNNLQTLTDCAMALYRGTCTSLTRLECIDDVAGITTEYMPTIERDNLIPGETVYIRFWDKSCNDRGYFNICVYTPRPENDECANAIPLDAPLAESCTYEVHTNYGATNSSGISNPGCGNYQGGDVWFTVSVEAGKRIVVTTQWGDIFNGGLALYSGDCTALTLLQCVGATGGGMPEISMQGFAEEQVLYVRFWSVGNIELGTFGICAYTTEEIGVNMGDSTVCHSSCSEFDPLIICDDGGTSDYSQNRDDTLTIYSLDTDQGFISLKFLEMDIDSTDTLFIYNGPTADPEYLTYEVGSKQASWVNNSNVFGLGEETGLSITAFWPNASGAITLRFKTGNTGAGTGFRLRSSCSVLCQPIDLNLTEMNNNIEIFPSGDPVTVLIEPDGNTYINLCPHAFPHDTITDTLTFLGVVNYPYSDAIYHQDNSTSLFTWRVGSEIITGYGLDQLTRAFPAGRGTAVSLTVTDTVGCIAPNIAAYRIRASQKPIKTMVALEGANVCAGDTLVVTFGYEDDNSVVLDPIGDEQISSLAVTDTIFLPDGENCPPYGYFYRSPVTFDAFSANDYIESIDDILSVCVNMEHSFIGDIRISLECPNGNSVMLLPDYQDTGWPTSGSTSAWMGFANETDDSGDGCDGSQYAMGIGWNYCWSNNTDQGYVYATGPNGYIYETANVIQANNPFNGTRSTIDSTDKAEMTQVYHPVESFENLVGCPMNGTWFIEVEDTWGIDNGFLFGWDLSLAPRLMPQAWEYEVRVDNVEPTGPFINTILGTDTSFVIEPPSDTPAGDYEYTFVLTDSYGCTFPLDSSFIVTVHQAYASYYEDEICQGIPYDGFGFYIANPPLSSTGEDTTIILSKFNLQTQEFGCDSSLNLALTIHPNKETFFTDYICEGDTYNENGFNVTGYAPGEWIYRNVDVTQFGCDTISTLYLNVQDAPDVEILGVLNLCKGASTTLTAMGCEDDDCSYLWSTGETTSSIEVSPDEDTEYSVTVSTSAACTGFAAVTVSVSNYPIPDIFIEGNLDIVCGDPTTLTVVDNNNVAFHYIWRMNGEIMEGETGPSITVIPTETSVFSVIVSSEHDCSDNATATVTVEPTTVGINATATTINFSESTTLSANNLTGVPSTYVWTWDDTTATGESITVSPEITTTYYLLATTIEGGCTAVAEITVTVIYIFAPPDVVDPEFFSGISVDSSCRAIVYWTSPDPAIMQAGGVFIGYNVYRDNELLTPTPIQADSLLDIQLTEGVYIYCVSCVYETGVSEKTCASINFVPEYNAPTTLTTSRTENCDASLLWNTPDKNCWADLNGYYIYRNDVLIDSVYTPSPIFDTLFTDENIGENRFNYCIQAFYKVNNQTRVSDKICTMVNTCFNVAVNIFPNPADDELTIVANEMERVMIYDESGRFLRQIDVPETSCRTLKVSTAHLANGVHLFHIFMRGDISTIKRVIIMH